MSHNASSLCLCMIAVILEKESNAKIVFFNYPQAVYLKANFKMSFIQAILFKYKKKVI